MSTPAPVVVFLEIATGTDKLDLDPCRARGIVVSKVCGYAVHSVPEHTFALILALRRRLFDYLADVLSLHCPLNEGTRNPIGAPELATMKRSAMLINTARGGLVDERALADALRRGVIAGAAVDVLSAEPPRDGNPLLAEDIPNLLVTPHVAWAPREAMEALAEPVVANIEGFLAGTPRNRVV